MMLPVRSESLFEKEAGNGNIKIRKSYMCYNHDRKRKRKFIYFLLLERSATGELQIVIFLTSFSLSGVS